MGGVKTIEWMGDRVRILDQTRLPQERVYLELRTPEEMIAAIREMRIRGAPALGVAGAYGLVLGALGIRAAQRAQFLERLRPIARAVASARPTAVNLSWGVERLLAVAERSAYSQPEKLQKLLLAEAQRLQEEDVAANRRLGQHGAGLLPNPATVLTHCNAGALATAGYGTALGVLRAAKEAGKAVRVYVDETRPLLQGARLTAWELLEEGFPVTLIADAMAGPLLRSGVIHCVVVGADRIAANGDVANKIGTYTLAVLARENGVPFYVAAPTNTVDLSLSRGDAIPIEERRPEEVTHIGETPLAPKGVAVVNLAFDVTPARYVTAIVTEVGVLYPPYRESLYRACGRRTRGG